MNTKKYKSSLTKVIVVGILSMMLLTSCNSNTDTDISNSSNPSTSSAVSTSDESNSSSESSPSLTEEEKSKYLKSALDFNPQENAPIDFSLIKNNFFGNWSSEESNQSEILIDYGKTDFSSNNYINNVYTDENKNTVMINIQSGEPLKYVVLAGEPDALYVFNANEYLYSQDITKYSKYSKSSDSNSSADETFGYFNILEYCLENNQVSDLTNEEQSPYNLFYNTFVALSDGTKWERLSNLYTPYPDLYLVEKSEKSITLKSLFYPEGTDISNDASSAKEIIFTIDKTDSGWAIKDAKLA